MTLKLKLAGLILLLFIAGCTKEKDELTLPVTVSSKISFSVDSSKCAEYLNFTGVRIGIGLITFIGIREDGPDYGFATDPRFDFPTSSSLSFLQKKTLTSNFNMPQGVYTEIHWEMDLWAITCKDLQDLIEGLTVEDLLATGVVEDLGENFWTGPAIAISGTYKSLNGSLIPFLLAGDFILSDDVTGQKLKAETFDPDGNSRIVLSADKEYESTLIFTMENDFRSINRELFEEANISGDSGHPVIIISGNNNKDLYEVLTSRNNLSIKVLIKETGSATR
jgi:hypothetical protein